MSETVSAATLATIEPALIVYGLDEANKAHASAFGADDVELALKAAGLMGMVALPVEGDECRALALALPVGKIFASGRAFTPFCKRAAFEALKALGGTVPPMPEAAPKTVPFAAVATSWETIQIGSLVLAAETAENWFEAVVVESQPEDLLVLRWRGWPDQAPVVRRRDDLGLLRQTLLDGLIEAK